jgi:hypothetical protein
VSEQDQNHFVDFHHYETRIASLERRVIALEEHEIGLQDDMMDMAEVILAYVEADLAAPWRGSAERLAEMLRKILHSRET